MSDVIVVAFIAAIPGIITAISQFQLHRKVDAVTSEVVTVKKEINGRMGELLKVTGEAEKAKGVIEGKHSQESAPEN